LLVTCCWWGAKIAAKINDREKKRRSDSAYQKVFAHENITNGGAFWVVGPLTKALVSRSPRCVRGW
jgi:hypothetical protein